MLYSITVDLADPAAPNDALFEALDIIRAKPLLQLRKRKQWLASTPYPPQAVRQLLDRSSRGDDQIEIVALPKPRTEALRDLLNHAS
jgi:hypothetical protein